MTRTALADRLLPNYTRGEEIMNMVTHIVGGAFGVVALVIGVIAAAFTGDAMKIVSVSIYGVTLVVMYTISSVYHGLNIGTAKKVMQVIDHCDIYFLIAGTYTPILLWLSRGRFSVWSGDLPHWQLRLTLSILSAIPNFL